MKPHYRKKNTEHGYYENDLMKTGRFASNFLSNYIYLELF